MEKFTRWLPAGGNEKPNPEQEEWLKENPNWQIKYTAFYRCGFENFEEQKRYHEYMIKKGYVLVTE